MSHTPSLYEYKQQQILLRRRKILFSRKLCGKLHRNASTLLQDYCPICEHLLLTYISIEINVYDTYCNIILYDSVIELDAKLKRRK